MQFAIKVSERGVVRRLGLVRAENSSSAIVKALRLWPQQVRRDMTAPMLMTELVAAH